MIPEIQLSTHPDTGELVPEEWKDVVGYEGLYRISNYGRATTLSKLGYKHKEEHLIHHRVGNGGYVYVRMSKNDIRKTFKVHRIVSLAFHPNPYQKGQVNHKNGKKSDNRSVNLEWATQSENMRHAHDFLGKNMDHFKKSVYQLSMDGFFLREFTGTRDASRETGIHATNIGECARGQRKSAGGFNWTY